MTSLKRGKIKVKAHNENFGIQFGEILAVLPATEAVMKFARIQKPTPTWTFMLTFGGSCEAKK